MNIIKSSVFMKSNPTQTASLETECLFGETVDVLKIAGDWIYCKLNSDNYCGWIMKNGLGKLKKTTHRISVKRSFVYIDKNPKSNCLFYLPLGAKLSIENIKSNWAEIVLFKNKKTQIGYVPASHIVELNHKVKDWVTTAQQLDGTPYKWGGRDSIGIDCSALLQLSYETYGFSLPRNTSQQVKTERKKVEKLKDLKRGCVIFWEGHVAIMIDNKNCIHANAFHMSTKTEPLIEIIKRAGNNSKIIKMMDFN